MASWVKFPGVVLSGGLPEPNTSVYVYEPSTEDMVTIYEDEGITQIDQPIMTSEAGTFFFFIDKETYPKIRLYFEKTGVDFSEMNEILDGISVP